MRQHGQWTYSSVLRRGHGSVSAGAARGPTGLGNDDALAIGERHKRLKAGFELRSSLRRFDLLPERELVGCDHVHSFHDVRVLEQDVHDVGDGDLGRDAVGRQHLLELGVVRDSLFGRDILTVDSFTADVEADDVVVDVSARDERLERRDFGRVHTLVFRDPDTEPNRETKLLGVAQHRRNVAVC